MFGRKNKNTTEESNSNAAIANTASAVAEDGSNNNSNAVYNAFPSTTVSGHDGNADSKAFELTLLDKYIRNIT